MIWKFLKQNVLLPKGLNWVQHWVSRIGLFRTILALFTQFAYTNFFICILPCGIFFLSLMMPLICKSSEFNFNFSSQGLTWTIFYLLTFMILNFHKIWVLTCTNLPTKTTKLQVILLFFNRSESLEYSQVFFLKLSAILFYSEIHCKPLKLCNKSLDRHILQKINEFAWLALAGRYYP